MTGGTSSGTIRIPGNTDRTEFREILARSQTIYTVKMDAGVLMGNHFHLLLETPLGNLNEYMRRKNSRLRDRRQRSQSGKKKERINIRMSSKDLDQVQVIAAQEGIPYQTLVSSIMHKYVSGYLIEKERRLND